jgi:hypothetical protein
MKRQGNGIMGGKGAKPRGVGRARSQEAAKRKVVLTGGGAGASGGPGPAHSPAATKKYEAGERWMELKDKALEQRHHKW